MFISFINAQCTFKYTLKTLKYHHIYIYSMSTFIYHESNKLTLKEIKFILLMGPKCFWMKFESTISSFFGDFDKIVCS